MASNEDPFGIQPARWFIGPPPPRGTSFLARTCSLAIMILVGHWVRVPLGGVGVKPVPVNGNTPGENDTGKIFNWHPILMTLGIVVLMAEALLSYQAPILPGLARATRKRIHWGCHMAAGLCLALGLVAVVQSHRLKRPNPMPDWYSPHSFLGLTALAIMGLQVLVGMYSYGWPKLSLSNRMALGPLHRFWGMAAWLAGLGAIASGLQEKVTFIHMKKPLTGKELHGLVVRLPAIVMPLLVVLAALVLYHQAPPATRPPAGDNSYGPGSSGGRASGQGLLRAGRPADDDDESDYDGSSGRRPV
ncbi:hypothetical protein Vretimale_8111 [Volvox reticuliferus]|uniref:Cytochrome b561 domain-containing protein n=1 Tax=Volvox reticuliferus TaxID=1737510 RepID=A0A8J4C635_9CHLO|nr:hypothetical protein Vretifemale_5258 [Volvox reticuliferus]GIM03356.1 hypothetical protein Vretimale_8111 [Volvox reticuliferus]